MRAAGPSVWFRALSYVLIFSIVTQTGAESQLACAQILAALRPARSSSESSGGLNPLLARSAANPFAASINAAVKNSGLAGLNGGLKQAITSTPQAAQLEKAMHGVPPASLASAVKRASIQTHAMGSHALKPIRLHAQQNLANITTAAPPLQPIDATGAPAADPNDPYIIAQAQALNNDPARIFAFVRDQIGTDVYQGSLRGARGALWTKAANSLDKASLLIALLGASGIQANYVHGALTTAQAQQSIASMFTTPSRVAGCPPPGSVLADPVNDPQLQADATDHFWVEFGPGSTPADPSFANAQLGQAFSLVSERFTSIPANLRHKVVFRLDTEFFLGPFQTITTNEVLSYSFDAAYLVGRPVTLGHFVNAPATPSLVFSVTTFQYSPFLRLPQDNPDPTLDRLLRGQDYQEVFTDFAGATQALTGVFLNMDVINSQGQSQTYTTTVLDRIGFAARHGGQASSLAISNSAPALRPLDFFTVAAMGSSESPLALQAYVDVASALQARGALLQQALAQVNFSNVSASDQLVIAQEINFDNDSFVTLSRITSLAFTVDSDTYARAQSQAYDVKSYWDSPRLIVFAGQTQGDPANPGQSRIRLSMDLRKDQTRVVAAPGQVASAPFNFNLLRGIAENHIEQADGGFFIGSLQLQGRSLSDSSTTTDIAATADSEGIDLLPVDGSNLGLLDALNLSADGKARILAAVEAGRVALVPSAPLVINGELITAWYEHDPVSGYTFDVFDDGTHQIAEYLGLVDVGKQNAAIDAGFVDGIIIVAGAAIATALTTVLSKMIAGKLGGGAAPIFFKIRASLKKISDLLVSGQDAKFKRTFKGIRDATIQGLSYFVLPILSAIALDPPIMPSVADLGAPISPAMPGTTPSTSLSTAQDTLFTVPLGGAQLPLVYAAQIQNTGPADDTFALSFPNPPPGYIIEQSLPSVLIPAGQTGQIGFCVVPNGQIGAPGATIPVSATVASTTNPAVNASTSVSITNPSVQAAVLTATPVQVTGTPGSITTATLNVQSVGNIPVTANLTATTSSGLSLSGLTTPVTIAPGSSVAQPLTLTVAPNATPNQPLFATITASYGDPTAPLTSDNPASITFLVVDPNAITAVNGSSAAGNAGRTDIALFLGQLSAAITNLAANPGSTTIQSQVLSLIDALAGSLNSPCLSPVAPALASARSQIAGADANSMPVALASLSTALGSLAAALASPCEFPFDFSLIPNTAIAQPSVPTAFKLFLQNKSLVPVTYDLSLSALPAGVSGGLNTSSVTLQPGQAVPAGNASDPAVILTQSNNLASFQFNVTASVDGIANSGVNATGAMTARNQFLFVQQVSANPEFISPGATTSVSASIANVVNDTLNVNVGLAVLNSSGANVLNVPAQSAQLNTQSLLTTINFGTINTQSLPAGSYTLQVTVSDPATGQMIPGGSGAGTLVIGSPLTATLTVSPQSVPPGNSSVTTTLSVTGGGGSVSNPLVLLGTQPTASPAESIALNGNLAYVCDNNEVTILDVTNPAKATILGTALSSGIANTGIAFCSVQRDTLVAFASSINSTVGNNFSISSFSLANPQQPVLINKTNTTQRFFEQPVFNGNLAFVPDAIAFFFVGVIWTGREGDLFAYDLSDFSHPVVAGSMQRTGATATWLLGASQASPDTLYVAGSTATGTSNAGVGRVEVVDISNPASMNVLSELDVPGTNLFWAPTIQGNIAVGLGVAGGFLGQFTPSDGNLFFGKIVVGVFDVSNPRSPVLLSATPTSFLSGPGGNTSPISAQIGPNLFLFGSVKDSNNNPLLLLVDATNPKSPVFRSFPVAAPVRQMIAQGTTLFTASGAAGFAAYQIPGLNATQFTAQVQVPKGTGVVYDPTSFSVQPAITTGTTSDTLTWANPPQSTITWNSNITGMQPGQVNNVALGGTVSFNGPSGPGSISLPAVSVTTGQILQITPGSANIQAGSPSIYTLTVNNPTGASITYNLAVTGISPNWVTLPASVTVGSLSQATVPLVIQTEATAPAGNYGFVVSASAASGLQGTVESSFALSGTGAPPAGGNGSGADNAVSLSLKPATGTAGQGTSTNFNLQVTNTGNVADTYTLAAVVPAGVTAVFDRPSVSVQPTLGNAQQVNLRLTVAPGTPAGSSSFSVTAISQTKPTVTSQQTGTLAISPNGVSIALNPTSTSPGGTLQATVTNLGSLADTFNLSLGGPAGVIATASPASVMLAPGASQPVTITVGPAPFATLGSLPMTAVATSQANPQVFADAVAGITIPARLGVTAGFNPSSQLLTALGSATYLLQAQNTGTVEDGYSATITSTSGSVSASLVGLDGKPTQSISQFRLPALSSGDIVLNVTAKDFGLDNITVQITSLTNSAINSTNTASLRVVAPPTANAGTDKTVTAGLSTRLDGTGSTDNNNPPLPLTFQWSLLSSPPGSALTNGSIRLANAALASFTPDVAGDYILQLAVSNGFVTSDATVTFHAQDVPPVAKAGRLLNVETGDLVTLDGSQSFDPDGSLITYTWQFVSVPPESKVTDAVLYNSLTPRPFFRPDAAGTYHLRLIVSDSVATSTPDFVDIVAYSHDVPPNANAGPDQFAALNSLVTLNGSAATAPENDDGHEEDSRALSFQWSFQNKPAGSALSDNSIQAGNSAHAQFVPDVTGDFVLRLAVSDGEHTADSSVTVHVVSGNLPPIANAGTNQGIALGKTTTLDATQSSDPDHGPSNLSFSWHLSSVAPNSTLQTGNITDAFTTNPSFTPDQPGNYVVRLAVNDGLDESYANVLVSASRLCDADHDGYITSNDIDLIRAAIGSKATPFDSRDFNSDGLITEADVDGCSALLPRSSGAVFPRALSFYADPTLSLALRSNEDEEDGGPFTASVNQPWIRVSNTTDGHNTILQVTVNPAGLAFGSYEGAVIITPSRGGPITVPVMMNIPLFAVSKTVADACIFALDPTTAGALQITGPATIRADCSIVVNSNSSSALSITGNGALNASSINIVGGVSQSGSSFISPSPSTGVPSQADPLVFLAPFNSNLCDHTNFTVDGSSDSGDSDNDSHPVVLNPGTYCNGIKIAGNSQVTLNPGTYLLLGGGLDLHGSSRIEGAGVTFFLSQGLGYSYGPLSISGSAVINLQAPDNGPLEGILFFQDPRIGLGQPSSTIQGSAAVSILGALYFPTTTLHYSGSTTDSEGRLLSIVADRIVLNGSVLINDRSGETDDSQRDKR